MSIRIEPLNSSFNKKDFNCGKEMLDNYLHLQASQDVKRKLSVVFVMVQENTVIGYYTLSNAAIPAEAMPEIIQKKMPRSYKSLPVTLLGRLAIDKNFKGKRLGAILLLDALKRCYEIASKSVGSIGVVVDPLDKDAIAFYKRFGFVILPDSDKMFLTMADIAQLTL